MERSGWILLIGDAIASETNATTLNSSHRWLDLKLLLTLQRLKKSLNFLKKGGIKQNKLNAKDSNSLRRAFHISSNFKL